MRVGIAISDTAAGMFLGQGILLALLSANSTGRGQWVHTSLLEAMLNMLDFQGARYTMTAKCRARKATTTRCRCRWARSNRATGSSMWRPAAARCGTASASARRRATCSPRPSIADVRARRAQQDAAARRCRRGHPALHDRELVEKLNAVGVPCGPINTIGEAFEDPQVKYLRMTRTAPPPRARRHRLMRTPINLSRIPDSRAVPPRRTRPGEHTDEVLREFGYDAAHIARLHALRSDRMKLSTDKILADVEGGIGWLTFNNPARRNAMSMEMWQGVGDALEAFQADPAVRVVVMRGAGGRAFVSGADISEFDQHRATVGAAADGIDEARGNRWLRQLDKPLIAMIQGYCIGGGLATALNADVRIATPGSTSASRRRSSGLATNIRGRGDAGAAGRARRSRATSCSARGSCRPTRRCASGSSTAWSRRTTLEADGARATPARSPANAPLTVPRGKGSPPRGERDPPTATSRGRGAGRAPASIARTTSRAAALRREAASRSPGPVGIASSYDIGTRDLTTASRSDICRSGRQ